MYIKRLLLLLILPSIILGSSRPETIEFDFFDEKIKLSKFFNIDKPLYEEEMYIPLAAKLVHIIKENRNTLLKLEAGLFLANILYKRDMKIASLYVLQNILIFKSSSGLIPLIFKIIIKIISEVKNDYVVSNFFNKIDTSKLSYDNIDAIRYIYGKALFKEGKMKKAISIFNKINPKYHDGKYYFQSKYYLATIDYLRNEKKKSLKYISEILSSKKKLPLELISQSNLLAARIYSDIGELEKSAFYYEKVPKESITWDQALLESSLVYLKSQKYSKVVGRTHSLNSPFFKMYYFPDGYIIEAIGYLKLCRFGRAKAILDEFNKTYKEYLPKLKNAKPTYENLYKEKTIPSRVIKTLARNNLFLSLHKGLQRIRFESASMLRFKSYAQSGRTYSKSAHYFYKFVMKKFTTQKEHHLKKLDNYLNNEINSLISNLQSLYEKFELIEYELYAQAKKYLESSLVDNGDIVLSSEETTASSNNRLYIWKFDYEYWKDELPYYEYAGKNLCFK